MNGPYENVGNYNGYPIYQQNKAGESSYGCSVSTIYIFYYSGRYVIADQVGSSYRAQCTSSTTSVFNCNTLWQIAQASSPETTITVSNNKCPYANCHQVIITEASNANIPCVGTYYNAYTDPENKFISQSSSYKFIYNVNHQQWMCISTSSYAGCSISYYGIQADENWYNIQAGYTTSIPWSSSRTLRVQCIGSDTPTKNPSKYPTKYPTKNPTKYPSKIPSKNPSKIPTKIPTNIPTKNPTKYPTFNPSLIPTKIPTNNPSITPTKLTLLPTKYTNIPTLNPTKSPNNIPTQSPTKIPSINPSNIPTLSPITQYPTINTLNPTNIPTILTTFNTIINNNALIKNNGIYINTTILIIVGIGIFLCCLICCICVVALLLSKSKKDIVLKTEIVKSEMYSSGNYVGSPMSSDDAKSGLTQGSTIGVSGPGSNIVTVNDDIDDIDQYALPEDENMSDMYTEHHPGNTVGEASGELNFIHKKDDKDDPYVTPRTPGINM